MAIAKQAPGELKSRVNICIDKLSDRDTLSMASNELENIAKTLKNDSFAPFLNCLSATDSSEKSPVRRQCVRLISILSAAHGDALSPHVSRMISAVLRRIRDPDSAVQAACVDAVASIAANVNSPPFGAILKPLAEALFQEQDLKPQICAALCLSAALEAAPEPDLVELRRLLPRVVKLVRSDSCKAKPALLLLVGSIVSSNNCIKSKSSLNSVVSTAVDFLSNGDWAVRKEAAEVLEKVAMACGSLVVELKASCVTTLESKRFDKVKLVREKMNRALELWKDLPEQSEGLSSPNDSTSPLKSPSNVGSVRKKHPTWSPLPSSSKMSLKTNTLNNNLDMMLDEDGFEGISLIRRQLQQIENQQSNLLDLLQRFMGRSQKGMRSLEQRVDGLEKVVDVMSHDFSIPQPNHACCMIPGAELLSPKLWRKPQGHTRVFYHKHPLLARKG